MFLAEWTRPVTALRGVGPVAAARLARLGVRTLAELLSLVPRDYQDRRSFLPLSSVREEGTLYALVRVLAQRWVGGGARRFLKVPVADESGPAALLCFGRSYLQGLLQPGRRFAVYGRFTRQKGELVSSSFELERWEEGKSSSAGLTPVYPLTEGLTQKLMRRLVRQALSQVGEPAEELPEWLRRRRTLVEKGVALRGVHFPREPEELGRARRRLAYEELFLSQAAVELLRRRRAAARRPRRQPLRELLPPALRRLPFALTGDQSRALEEIRSDLRSEHPAARLLQGEVGSGKTLVALLAALEVIGCGEQAGLLAPTELLARQHADSAARLLEPLGLRVALLSGGVQGEARRSLLSALREGEVDLAVGTHSLFSPGVEYRRLGLVIVDEQHRFGVRQREALLAKGRQPDLLLLTATPIPRTLALTAFGDMDLSEIRTLPAGRTAVITHLAREGNEAKVYDRVRRELAAGGQAYFVYPLIEETGSLELKAAERMFRRLQKEIFPEHPVGLIHSRLPEERRQEVMAAFAAGKVSVLVATSVLEVGVDVPGATCMVVEHAERFGLAALHQLRGRVGRGVRQGYAFLVYSRELTAAGVERLRAIMTIRDGFRIAEEDLKIRGPGEILGVRQSGYGGSAECPPSGEGGGYCPWDAELLALARSDARELLQLDPALADPQHRGIRMLVPAPAGRPGLV